MKSSVFMSQIYFSNFNGPILYSFRTEYEFSVFLRNVGTHLQVYEALQTKMNIDITVVIQITKLFKQLYFRRFLSPLYCHE
jgi:hypothetical protein